MCQPAAGMRSGAARAQDGQGARVPGPDGGGGGRGRQRARGARRVRRGRHVHHRAAAGVDVPARQQRAGRGPRGAPARARRRAAGFPARVAWPRLVCRRSGRRVPGRLAGNTRACALRPPCCCPGLEHAAATAAATAAAPRPQALQRPFHYAVVDEVDLLLIDDCRNPLILSRANEAENVERFALAAKARAARPRCGAARGACTAARFVQHVSRRVQRVASAAGHASFAAHRLQTRALLNQLDARWAADA